jgi:hypothetical protein
MRNGIFIFIFVSLFSAAPLFAKSPSLNDPSYYETRTLSISRGACLNYSNCLTAELSLGAGSRARAVKRIQKIAARQGLVVRVLRQTKTHPTSRMTLQIAGNDRDALNRVEKKILTLR